MHVFTHACAHTYTHINKHTRARTKAHASMQTNVHTQCTCWTKLDLTVQYDLQKMCDRAIPQYIPYRVSYNALANKAIPRLYPTM